MISELPGILSQRHEHTLCYVFGQVGVANHAQRGRIDKIDVASHDFGKRRL